MGVYFQRAEAEQHLSGMLKAFLATKDHEERINMPTRPRLIPYRRRKTSRDSSKRLDKKHNRGMQNGVAVTRQGKQSDGLQTVQQAADAVITIRPLLTFLQGDVCMSENLTGILMVSGNEGLF